MNQVGASQRLGQVAKQRYIGIIYCLAKGLTVKESAAALGKPENYVKSRLQRIRDHFGAATNVEAILMARREWKLDL